MKTYKTNALSSNAQALLQLSAYGGLYYWLTHEVFGANDFFLGIVLFLFENKYILFASNWSVIILELIIPLLLFAPKNTSTSKFVFYVAILFHLFIIVFQGIFSFAIVMIGCLFFYFNFFTIEKINLIVINFKSRLKQN